MRSFQQCEVNFLSVIKLCCKKILNTPSRFIMDLILLILPGYCFNHFYSLFFLLQLADFKLLQFEVGKSSEPGAYNLQMTSCHFVKQSHEDVRVGGAYFSHILQQLSVK